MLKRILLGGGVLTVVMGLMGSVTLWVVLSLWLPTKGKARLMEALEQHTPTEVSIGTLGYQPFHGIVLKDVRVVGRASQELWGAAPTMHVQVDWLTLVLSRRVAFRARAVLERPLHTSVMLSGRYHPREQSLSLEITTTEILLRSVTAPLTRYLPPPLTDGTLRVQLHLEQSPPGPAAITGRIEGSRLTWETPSWSLRGDVVFEGTATPPLLARARWMVEGDVALRRATLEGLAAVGPIDHLEGRAHVSPERLEIRELTGTALGSPWTLEGEVAMDSPWPLEALITSRANLAPLAAALLPGPPLAHAGAGPGPPLAHAGADPGPPATSGGAGGPPITSGESGPALKSAWQPDGVADLRAVCRGPLQPTAFLDCLVSADVQEATLAGSKLTHTLTNLTGHVSYDLLARDLSIDRLTARLHDQPLAVSGDVEFQGPRRLGLHVTGAMPLDMALPWLPANSTVSGLGGLTMLDLEIRGPFAAPSYTGELTLREGRARLTKPAMILEQAVASVRLSPHRIDVSDTSLTVNGQPLTLSATIEPSDMSHWVATVGLPHGRLRLDSRVTPTDVLVDPWTLTLTTSQLQLRGRIARHTEQPSALDLSGTVELAEMARLPWFPLPALEAWELKGTGVVESQVRGRLSDWSAATIQGRFRADQVRVRNIPIDQVTVTLEQRDRVLRVQVPSSFVAQGKTWGELVIDHRPTTHTSDALLQVDVVGLQLTTLAQAIPAWRARSVTGSASTHALLSGTWQEPRTWRGEGWLNASGERLADLPLLDKVFRGLFGVLGDRLGLESLRRAQITQASCRWRLLEERVHTDDLRLGGLAGTEPVAIYAKGSVGLDRTLDFVIEPELSEGVMVQAPTTSTLASTVLKAAGGLERLRRLIGRHRLTGTLDDPDYRFELTTQEIFKQLAPRPGDLFQQLLDAVN